MSERAREDDLRHLAQTDQSLLMLPGFTPPDDLDPRRGHLRRIVLLGEERTEQWERQVRAHTVNGQVPVEMVLSLMHDTWAQGRMLAGCESSADVSAQPSSQPQLPQRRRSRRRSRSRRDASGAEE